IIFDCISLRQLAGIVSGVRQIPKLACEHPATGDKFDSFVSCNCHDIAGQLMANGGRFPISEHRGAFMSGMIASLKLFESFLHEPLFGARSLPWILVYWT